MRRTNVRARVIREARRDAAAYSREFRRTAGPKETDWVTEAWADLRNEFKLQRTDADRLWPAYSKAFSEEMVRLAAIHGLNQ
jgi:hypothetical protein